MNRPRQILVSSSLLLSAALLWGCAVGPDYHPPATSMPAGYSGARQPPSTQQTSVVTEAPVDLNRWWASFKDPQLNSLIDCAVAANLDLAVAESRVRQARAARTQVSTAFWPTVNVNGQASRGRSFDSGETNLFQAGLDAAWELDVFGGTRRNIESATASLEAAVEDRRNVLVTLLSEVALNYVQLRGFQQQIVVAQNNLDAQMHTLDIARRRFNNGNGFSSGLDVANAEAQAQTTAATIPVLQTTARQAVYSISILLAVEPAALEGELSAPRVIPPVPPAVPVGLPSELLRRRPDVREAEKQLHAANAQIGVATADLFPKFSLTGSFGQESSQLHNFFNYPFRFWSFGPAVNWPLFDAGAIQANIKVQKELTRQALLTYRKTVLTALQDVDNALVAYSNEQVHHAILERAVAANRRAVDLSNRLYTEGLLEFVNVLVAQSSLNSAENQLVQSQEAISADLIFLYKAIGGGWETFDLQLKAK